MCHFLGNLAVFWLKIFIVISEETMRKLGGKAQRSREQRLRRSAGGCFSLLSACFSSSCWQPVCLAIHTAGSVQPAQERGALRRAPLGAPLPRRGWLTPRLRLFSALPCLVSLPCAPHVEHSERFLSSLSPARTPHGQGNVFWSQFHFILSSAKMHSIACGFLMIFIYFFLKNVGSKKNDLFKVAFADTLPVGFSNVVLGVFSFMSIKTTDKYFHMRNSLFCSRRLTGKGWRRLD